jgi:very-short-patch-repair endonuclease/predicted transcriptional regulator of viral defense system
VVTVEQLYWLGLSRSGVHNRVARGRLHRLYRGVYAVGHTSLTVDGKRMAAVLACGPGAALSHRSAGAVWGICRDGQAKWDVTTAGRGRKAPTNIRLHRVRAPLGAAVANRHGIPVTTVARTLLDLADVLPRQALERALHEAEHLRLLDARELTETIGGASGRRTKALAAALAEPSPGITRSVLEERFADLIARTDLPPLRRNVHVHIRGGLVEVDVLWPDEKVIVELDGAAHRTRRAFEADRRRDTALAVEGYVVIRLTWDRVTREPAKIAEELRRLIASRRQAQPIP